MLLDLGDRVSFHCERTGKIVQGTVRDHDRKGNYWLVQRDDGLEGGGEKYEGKRMWVTAEKRNAPITLLNSDSDKANVYLNMYLVSVKREKATQELVEELRREKLELINIIARLEKEATE